MNTSQKTDGDAMVHSIDGPIEQRNSARGKPSAIAVLDVELNSRQKALLEALPSYDARLTVAKSEVNMVDLAALTAKNR